MTGEQNGYNLEMRKKGEADNSVIFSNVTELQGLQIKKRNPVTDSSKASATNHSVILLLHKVHKIISKTVITVPKMDLFS